MPHHSAQKRQMTPGAFPVVGSSSTGGSLQLVGGGGNGGGGAGGGVGGPNLHHSSPPMMTASMSFPPRSAYGDYPAAHRGHPGGVQQQQGSQGGGPPPSPYANSFHHQHHPHPHHAPHHHQQQLQLPHHHLQHLMQQHQQQQHPPVSMASSWATSSPSGSSVHNNVLTPGAAGAAGSTGERPVVHRVDLLHDQEALHQPQLLHESKPRTAPHSSARVPHGVGEGGGASSSVSSRSATAAGASSSSVVDDDAMSSASTQGGTGSAGGDSTGTGGGGTPRLLLSNDHSRSFDSTTPHEVAAASVLLLAATAMKEYAGETGRFAVAAPTPAATTPLLVERHEPERTNKKRKQQQQQTTAAGIMRKKSSDATSQASHVSPYSQASAGGNSNRDHDHDADSPKTAATSTPVQDRRHTAGSSPSSSYDLKDGQALHDSAKINDPKDIALSTTTQSPSLLLPPSHVEIPHFPSVLHAVLTESEFAGKVLLWLPHGQAWRIVRWDALRRLVLPKYFSQLNEDSSPSGGGIKDSASGTASVSSSTATPSGSIDAFLWHLAAWGFEEVNDGPDVGAYSHVLFRRELPGLCREMRFAPSSSAATTTPIRDSDKDSRAADVGGARYILQVPSLASTGGATSSELGRNPGDDDNKVGSSYPNQVTPAWPSRPYVSVGYHPHAHPAVNNSNSTTPAPGSGGGPWKYYPEHSQWVGSSSSNNATETSSPTSVTSQRSVPPYSPIRVRSGRGACRLPLNRSRTVPDAADPVIPRSSFPVSNRGKGGKAAVRRVSHPCPSDSPLAATVGVVISAATSSSGAVPNPSGGAADDGADSITSNKPRMSILKRKLPLMRKSLSSSSAPSPFVAADGEDDNPGVAYTTNPDLTESRARPSAERAEEEEKKEDEEGDATTLEHGASEVCAATPGAAQLTPI